MVLRKVLDEKGMYLPELSRLTGINYHTLRKYTERKTLTVDSAKKIGKVLGFDWWLLFEDEEEPEKVS